MERADVLHSPDIGTEGECSLDGQIDFEKLDGFVMSGVGKSIVFARIKGEDGEVAYPISIVENDAVAPDDLGKIVGVLGGEEEFQELFAFVIRAQYGEDPQHDDLLVGTSPAETARKGNASRYRLN
jgi:hypothetical protein